MNFMLQGSPCAVRARGLIKSAAYALVISVFLVRPGFTQEPPHQHPHAVTPLADLLKEAEQNNPQIQAARDGWQAAKQVPTQVSTLPDPQFQVQQVNVGSPRPFAGYTNSRFRLCRRGCVAGHPLSRQAEAAR